MGDQQVRVEVTELNRLQPGGNHRDAAQGFLDARSTDGEVVTVKTLSQQDVEKLLTKVFASQDATIKDFRDKAVLGNQTASGGNGANNAEGPSPQNLGKLLHLERELRAQELINNVAQSGQTLEAIKNTLHEEIKNKKEKLKNCVVKVNNLDVPVYDRVDQLQAEYLTANGQRREEIAKEVAQIYAQLTQEQRNALLEYRVRRVLLDRLEACEGGYNSVKALQSKIPEDSISISVENRTVNLTKQNFNAEVTSLFLFTLRSSTEKEMNYVISKTPYSFPQEIAKLTQMITEKTVKQGNAQGENTDITIASLASGGNPVDESYRYSK
ncbi:MAG: hypothetical protein NZT61_06710 [Deltaproteobacteria bacterium]|nr:hypothetical protein [Deltaproteobacteria bacterium]MCX7953139.1 hypothetical protein [Deltaproteobacteria bacterium]